MSEEYAILIGTKGNTTKTQLISVDTLADADKGPHGLGEYFFGRGYEATDAGRVQIIGDTHLLTDIYTTE